MSIRNFEEPKPPKSKTYGMLEELPMLENQGNVYSGKFDTHNWYQVFKNGVPFSHEASLKVRNHSPTGFAWSYGGSGPAQLALAILLEETDSKCIAEHYYMDFKFEVIAGLPQEKPWQLTSVQIQKWLQDTFEKELAKEYRIAAGRNPNFLDLPTAVREEYMLACFKYGPDSTQTKEARTKYQVIRPQELLTLFTQFADATDNLKRRVGGSGIDY